MQKADTEYLAREIAALRIALGEVATRDFLRSELARLAEELDDAAHRRSKAERKELRRASVASGRRQRDPRYRRRRRAAATATTTTPLRRAAASAQVIDR